MTPIAPAMTPHRPPTYIAVMLDGKLVGHVRSLQAPALVARLRDIKAAKLAEEEGLPQGAHTIMLDVSAHQRQPPPPPPPPGLDHPNTRVRLDSPQVSVKPSPMAKLSSVLSMANLKGKSEHVAPPPPASVGVVLGSANPAVVKFWCTAVPVDESFTEAFACLCFFVLRHLIQCDTLL